MTSHQNGDAKCEPEDCKDCENGCATLQSAMHVDIEDWKTELSALQQRSRELEKKLSSMGVAIEDDAKVNGTATANGTQKKPLRSTRWFNNPDNMTMSALYTERYLNFGLTQEELMSSKPIIGIANSGSDLAPCNRHHLELAKRVREGIRSAGGIALEFPTHPIQENGRRPTATLDRNLSYLTLTEILYAYPIDGVVLMTGCDKTTPACLMAAATINIPSIVLNVGPMMNGHLRENKRIGSGSILWTARELYAEEKINMQEFIDMVASGAPSVGHCNTMGTASTMNALAEALGMALPGSAAIPAPYRERGHVSYKTGMQIVEMVQQDRRPSDIMTREAFENAIVANTAIGGSTNAPIHLNAVAKCMGVPLDLDDWDNIGFDISLLLNMQPAGEMLSEDYFLAGGLPAIMAELLDQGKLHADAMTVNGHTMGDNVRGQHTWDRATIRSYDKPMKSEAGFLHMRGTLFDHAIMKTSVISADFRKQFLSNPNDPDAFEGECIVFDGPEQYNSTIEDADNGVTASSILVMRGTGPLGYPGAAEVVNMHPPGRLIKQGVRALPCIGDGRQSGTSGSPSILNASPEAAAGGNLAILRNRGDRLRVDLRKRRVDILLPDEEIARRRAELEANGGYKGPDSHTPWQEIFRNITGQLDEGMLVKGADKYQRVAQKVFEPRHNH